MGNALQRDAIQRVIDRAQAVGLEVPDSVKALVTSNHGGNLGAVLSAQANPDRADEMFGCCYGDANGGPDHCFCWTPVYAEEQATPQVPDGTDGIEIQPKLCGDCAFRNDSPERADEWMEEALMALPVSGDPFWCHEGMRRPVRWEHPDGRTVPGSTADWHPAMVGPVPFRADGRPALLCAGWAALFRSATR